MNSCSPGQGQEEVPSRQGISHPWLMTASPVTASAEQGWLSHTPGMMPTRGVYAQVWKSQQPGSSPFQSRQGTDAESGPPEEIALIFRGNHTAIFLLGWSVRLTPLSAQSAGFSRNQQKRKMEAVFWEVTAKSSLVKGEGGGGEKREASCCHILTLSSIQLSRDSFKTEQEKTTPTISPRTLNGH